MAGNDMKLTMHRDTMILVVCAHAFALSLLMAAFT